MFPLRIASWIGALALVMRQCARLSGVVDAGAFAAATCIVAAAAALAAYLPARRATRINPSQALRAGA